MISRKRGGPQLLVSSKFFSSATSSKNASHKRKGFHEYTEGTERYCTVECSIEKRKERRYSNSKAIAWGLGRREIR
jgi:hypothetical protein